MKTANIAIIEDKEDTKRNDEEEPNVEIVHDNTNKDQQQETPTDHIHQTVNVIPPDAPALDAPPCQSTLTNTPVDRVSSALPKVVSLTREHIRQATCYIKSDILIKHLTNLGTKSVHVSQIESTKGSWMKVAQHQ